MSALPLPQRPRSHVLDEEAIDYIKNILPTEWIVEAQRKDYGIDLNVEIVTNESVTGAHFIIQSKGTDSPKYLKSGFISYRKCKVSTLQYFLERQELVVFIIYDSTKKTAYWIWIQEYIKKELKIGWQKQDTATIKIPINQEFDTDAIKSIMKKVLETTEPSKLLTTVQTIDNPYTKYNFSYSDNKTTVTLLEKYEGALEDNPIYINAKFKFGKDHKSQEVLTSLDKAIKTGEPTIIDSKYIEDLDLSMIMPELLRQFGDIKPIQLEISTPIEKDYLPIKLEILDENHSILAEIPYIELRLIKAGTEEKTYSNEHQESPLIILMKISIVNHNSTFRFSINFGGYKVNQISNIFLFLKSFGRGKLFRLVYLRDGSEITHKIPSLENLLPDKKIVEILEDTYFIFSQTYNNFQYPAYISEHDFKRIKLLKKILSTGEDFAQNDYFTFWVDEDNARKYLEAYTKNEILSLRFEQPESEISLFDTDIHLGPRIVLIPKSSLTEETKKTIVSFQESDHEHENVEITVDLLEQGLLQVFPNWLPTKSE